MAVLLWSFRKEFYVLLVIDLDESNPIRTIVALLNIWFGEPEKVLVKNARCLQIANVQRHMRHTKDARPSLLLRNR
jgi:hypothetical protein